MGQKNMSHGQAWLFHLAGKDSPADGDEPFVVGATGGRSGPYQHCCPLHEIKTKQ